MLGRFIKEDRSIKLNSQRSLDLTMWEKHLLLSIALLGLIGGAKPEKQSDQETVKLVSQSSGYESSEPSKKENCTYSVIFFAVKKSGTIGVMVFNAKCRVNVNASIFVEFQDKKSEVFNVQIKADSDFFDCRKFDVATVKETQLALIRISMTGEGVDIKQTKPFAIVYLTHQYFFDTDKPIYAPNDTVSFRLYCLDYNRLPVDQQWKVCYLVEPYGSNIQQQRNPVSNYGMIVGKFKLSEWAASGSYRIECETQSGEIVTQYFTMEPYELPRFNTIVKCPSTIVPTDALVIIRLTVNSTYDQSLNGTVNTKCTRPLGYYSQRQRNCLGDYADITQEFTQDVINGSAKITLSMKNFRLPNPVFSSYMNCEITFKEAGTDILDTKRCFISITRRPVNLWFEYRPQFYRRCIDLILTALLTNQDGEPMVNKTLVLTVNYIEVAKVNTDADGRAKCVVVTSSFTSENVTIEISYQAEDQCYYSDQSPWIYNYPYAYDPGYPYDRMTVFRFVAPSDCYIQIRRQSEKSLPCGQNHTIVVDYKLAEEAVGKGKGSTTFYYVVTSNQEIVSCGKVPVYLTSNLKGSFSVSISITPKCSPYFQCLVYAMTPFDIAADSISFNVESCFENKVSQHFNKTVVKPGENVEQVIHAAPGSMCGVGTMDISLTLLNSYGSGLNADDVAYSLSINYYGYRFGDIDLSDADPPCKDPNAVVFCQGGYYSPTSSWTDGSTYNMFETIGISILSNLRKKNQQVCGMERPDPGPIWFSHADRAAPAAFAASAGGAATVETNRNNRADSLGWMTVITNNEGIAIITFTTPDDITSWISNAACVSKKEGFGMAKQAKFTTMLLFFHEANMVKICKRGETAIVSMTVTSNLKYCCEVNMEIRSSAAFNVTSIGNHGSICVCEGQRFTTQFEMKFNNIGLIAVTTSVSTTSISNSCGGPNDESVSPRIDTLSSTVNVQSEGVAQENAVSFMVIVNAGTKENSVEVTIPENAILDTVEIILQVSCDLTSLSTANLNSLLRQPSGCCLTNLATMTANLEVLKYFESSGNTEDDRYKKAKSNLCTAYSQHMGCKQSDGTFSNFYDTNMMTIRMQAETFALFCDIQKNDLDCYVDDQTLEVMLQRMEEQQNKTSGCFSSPQDKNDIKLTAVMIMGLSKCDKPIGLKGPVLDECWRCIEAADLKAMDTQTKAAVFNAAAMNNRQDIAMELAAMLRNNAITAGGTTYWSLANVPLGNRCSSTNVEITAMCLSAFLDMSSEPDLDFCSTIAHYLHGCMNARGGWISVWDTIEALNALSKFSKFSSVPYTDCEIVVSKGEDEITRVTVDEEGKTVVHRKSLNATGKITVTTSGTCACLAQVITKCNVKVTKDDSVFSLNVTTAAPSCTQGMAPILNVTTCIKYVGMGETGIAYMTIGMLSGYDPALYTFRRFNPEETVSNVGLDSNQVVIYFSNFKAGEEKCVTFQCNRKDRVMAAKDGTVTVAEYNIPDNSASTTYKNPCSNVAG